MGSTGLIRWLSVADRHMKMYLDQHLAPLGLNSSQHMYVLYICEQPGVTQEQLMHHFYIHPSNITRALSGLVRAGFLRKESNPQDKRTSCLFPTQRAYEVREPILRILAETEAALFSGLGEEILPAFRRDLQAVALRAVELTQDLPNERR